VTLAPEHRSRSQTPRDPGPCVWDFPDARAGDEDGLVAIGADLAPSTLVHAYRHGTFPWPHGKRDLPWFSPDPRGVLPLDDISMSKTLRQTLRRSGWTATVDTAFADVVDACSTRVGEGTWITPKMRAAYIELHQLGWTHSIEIWDEDRLVGGCYGVLVGAMFIGESMFHRVTDASKVALVELGWRLREGGAGLIDVQLVTDHLASMGARPIPRPLYLEILNELRDDHVTLLRDRLPVSRHTERSPESTHA
jgi:leucyl/phenylalanyl-tRNA---protein transferase